MFNHRKKTENLPAAELLSVIISQIDDAVFIFDSLGNLSYSGGKIQEIFGYSADELKQISNINQLFDNNLLNKLVAEDRCQSKGKKNKYVPRIVKHKFGRNREVQIKLKKIPGKPELFLITCREITGFKHPETESQKHRYWEQLEKVVELRTEQLRLANLQLEKQIIELQRAEAEIQSTVERLTTIIETVAEGITFGTFGNETGHFEVFNSKMEEITGYTKEEANSCENFLALLYPDPQEYQKAMAELQTLANSGENNHIETIICTKDGQQKTLLVSSSLLRDGHRNLFLSAYRDITQRQAAEKALAESEARKRSLLAAIPDALFCIHRDGTFLEFIPAKNFQPFVPIGQFIGKKITDILLDPLATNLMDLVGQTLDSQTTQVLEYQLLVENQIRDYELRIAVFIEDQVLAIVRDISDRKQAERSVQKHMQWNQLILDTTMDGFFRFDSQGNILEVNAAFSRIVRYSPDRLLGMNVQDLLALETPEEVRKHIQTICDPNSANNPQKCLTDRPNKSNRFKSKYRRSDGEVIHVEISVTVTDLGDERLLFAFVRDISDRVLTAQALVDSQRFIQKITDTVPVIIYIYDLVQNKHLYFNSQICHILGYSIEQIRELEQDGLLLKNFLYSDGTLPEKNLRHPWQYVKDGETIQAEMRIKTAKGVWRNFQCEETLFLRSPDGLPKQILGVAIDVTERKQTQEKLLRLSKAVKSTSDAIAMTDISGNAIYLNPAFVKLFGYKLPELIAEGGPSVVYNEPTVAEAVFTNIEQGGSWRGEVKMQTRDGQAIDILLRADAIKDELGIIIGFISIYTDISDRKRAQEQLAQHAMELARSNAELEQFAYVASHDLQEPLRIITSYIQLLSRRYLGKFDSKADKYIYFVVKAAQRMQQLIEDLLEFSRSGSEKSELTPIESEAVLDTVLDNLNLIIRRSGATVTHDPLPTVMGDRIQLVQLWQNLIGNGVKYRGGRSPVIHISATRLNHHWCFAVSDNGIGIASEFYDRIFAIFQRLHSREEYPGTGIGLAVCKKIVQRHEGEIWVESQPGEGSTFYFTLLAID